MKTLLSKTLLIVITMLLLQGCDKCKDIACFTPPEEFRFALVDKITKENLFTNQTFDASQVSVTNLDTKASMGFNFISENNQNLLVIYSIGWQTEKVNAQVNVSNKEVFTLSVDAERKNENCCSFTKINEIKITNAESERNTANGVYTVLVAK